MEEARAFKEGRAVKIQDERKNIFRVGTKNIRPRALNLLIADGIVIKTNNGKYLSGQGKTRAGQSAFSFQEIKWSLVGCIRECVVQFESLCNQDAFFSLSATNTLI